jgi:hypothetical protein
MIFGANPDSEFSMAEFGLISDGVIAQVIFSLYLPSYDCPFLTPDSGKLWIAICFPAMKFPKQRDTLRF